MMNVQTKSNVNGGDSASTEEYSCVIVWDWTKKQHNTAKKLQSQFGKLIKRVSNEN